MWVKYLENDCVPPGDGAFASPVFPARRVSRWGPPRLLSSRTHLPPPLVDSASLATFTISPSSTLTYNLTVAMTVRNPNKRVSLYYDNVEALALFEGQRFGFAPLDAFYQGTQESRQLAPVFGGQQVLDGDVAPANFRSQQSAGAFDVEVKLNARLRVKVWAFKVREPRARISCPLSLPAPGAASPPAFKPVDCKVWF
ncbi:NDR1/HIN1-like protein 10 [Lolium perenne]|uniref:NDR1/HIN1-like protein 10 n=1 Tax=Lolium perenne TaxID=4522 RepID=UPI0021EB0598|nr:NDR1/HIN1-like protein 10 [Lolium perenne]